MFRQRGRNRRRPGRKIKRLRRPATSPPFDGWSRERAAVSLDSNGAEPTVKRPKHGTGRAWQEPSFQALAVRLTFFALRAAEEAIPAGTLVVPSNQPLGRLLVLLLEPRSEDSLAAWNLMDEVLEKQKPQFYPVWRTAEAIP
jgi:hypothetical protein